MVPAALFHVLLPGAGQLHRPDNCASARTDRRSRDPSLTLSGRGADAGKGPLLVQCGLSQGRDPDAQWFREPAGEREGVTCRQAPW